VGGSHGKGYIDTGSEMLPSPFDQHVYVSVVAVEDMARIIGWSPPAEMRQAQIDVAERNARVEQLEAELSDAHKALDAVDVMESAGFVKRKKLGRPRKEEVEA